MTLIEIKIIPQPMDDEFNAKMDEAHSQQRVAQEAQNLLKALKGLLAEPDSVAWKLLAELYVRNAEGR